jgi:hypothetical protein
MRRAIEEMKIGSELLEFLSVLMRSLIDVTGDLEGLANILYYIGVISVKDQASHRWKRGDNKARSRFRIKWVMTKPYFAWQNDSQTEIKGFGSEN